VFKSSIAQPFTRSVAAAEAAVAAAAAADDDDDDGDVADLSPPSAAAGQWYGRAERDGVRRLLALLQPLMWRSNKMTSALDHPLPPRQVWERECAGEALSLTSCSWLTC